jgi:hypothetical protein
MLTLNCDDLVFEFAVLAWSASEVTRSHPTNSCLSSRLVQALATSGNPVAESLIRNSDLPPEMHGGQHPSSGQLVGAGRAHTQHTRDFRDREKSHGDFLLVQRTQEDSNAMKLLRYSRVPLLERA